MAGNKNSGRKRGQKYDRRNRAEIKEDQPAGTIRGQAFKAWKANREKERLAARREQNKLTNAAKERIFSSAPLPPTGPLRQSSMLLQHINDANDKVIVIDDADQPIVQPIVVIDVDDDDGPPPPAKKQRGADDADDASDADAAVNEPSTGVSVLPANAKSEAHQKAALAKSERRNKGNPPCNCPMKFGPNQSRRSSAARFSVQGYWYFGCPAYTSKTGDRGCKFWRRATNEESIALEAKKRASRNAA